MHSFKTYHSPIYRGFKSIEVDNHRSVIRYFEEHEDAIVRLEFGEYFEMLVAYSNALFEIGAYTKHLLMADVIVEASIEENVQYFHGEDVYYNTLFRKAASFYNLYEYDKAEHILRELIKMNPYDTNAVSFYKRCLMDRKGKLLKRMRAGSMVFFLLTPVIIAIQVLVIQNFYSDKVELFEDIWLITFLLGWVFYLSGDLLHRQHNIEKVKKLVNTAKHEKKRLDKVFY